MKDMKELKTLFILLIFGLSVANCSGQSKATNFEPNKISFEKTDYGLIFTTITVNDKNIKAMIDFGDQHKLQLSSTLIDELNIETEEAGYQVSDVYGNTWDVKKGTAQKLFVGNWEERNVEFTSQEGEMESVSKQIGTEFNAVLGWGYFKDYFTEIDYSASLITLYDKKYTVDNELFSVQFQKDANQLIIPATVNNQSVRFMIDTGSPVTVVDSTFKEKLDYEKFMFSIDNQDFEMKAYSQDLSVLSDLEIVCILGSDFLKEWKVIIDPAKSILHFTK
jgi:predicted aspartyl protease